MDAVASADERPTALQAVDSQAAAGDAVPATADPGEGLDDHAGVHAPSAQGDQAEAPGPEPELAPREAASGGGTALGPLNPAAPDRGPGARASPELRVRLTPDGAATARAAPKPLGPDPWLLFNDEAISASSADEARALYDGRVAPCLLYYTQARCLNVQLAFPPVPCKLCRPSICTALSNLCSCMPGLSDSQLGW